MDSLLELIDSRIGKALAKSDCVNSQVGQVLSANDNLYNVKLFTTGAVYAIPNYSGSDLVANELVQVYWRGGFLSNQTAYIGAALTKDSGGAINYLPCTVTPIVLSDANRRVALVDFTASKETTIMLFFNSVIDAEESGDVTFTVYLDGTALSYTPKLTTVAGYNHCSFTIPIPLTSAGDYEVIVRASGTGEITQIVSFIEGDVIPHTVIHTMVTRIVDFYGNTKSIEGDVDALQVYSLMRRCNVADDGTINAYYGESGYTEDGSNGQVMVYVKKFYYKMTPITLGNPDNHKLLKGSWTIADTQIDDDFKLHPAFYDAAGNEIDYFLYGAFEAVGQDGNGNYSSSYNTTSYKLSSVGGNTMKPITGFSRATARTMGANRGTGWYSTAIWQHSAIQMLFGVEFGFNSQITVGKGICNDSAIHNTGETTGNTTSGTIENTTTAVNWRGIENLWGNVFNWNDGINFYGYKPYICDSFTFVDDTSTGYTQIAFNLPSYNWVSEFGYDDRFDWLLLPIESTSTDKSNDQIGDRVFAINQNAWKICRMGGQYTVDTSDGIMCWSCDINSNNTGVDSGARLMYLPQS